MKLIKLELQKLAIVLASCVWRTYLWKLKNYFVYSEGKG